MAKRTRTDWRYKDMGKNGTWIKIGLTKNADVLHKKDYKYDCIRMQIRSAWEGQEDIDFCVRMDEAASMAAGFSQILAYIMSSGHPELKALSDGHIKGEV